MENAKLTKGLRKSSRSKADLFEVLVAQSLARNYNIKKDFSKEIQDLKDFLRKFENGHFRIEEQEERVEEAVKKNNKVFEERKHQGYKEC